MTHLTVEKAVYLCWKRDFDFGIAHTGGVAFVDIKFPLWTRLGGWPFRAIMAHRIRNALDLLKPKGESVVITVR